jgi:hypothetical protein
MPRRESQPDKRAADVKREVAAVRRKYKVDLNKRKKLMPAEIPGIKDTIIVLKLAGYSRSQMSKIVGISKGQIKELLEEADVTERIVTLRSALPQAALDLLQGYMIEAVQAIVDVMRRTNDDKLIIQAAGEILDRAGLPKSSRQERSQINENRTIITDDGLLDRLRGASPEVQEQAAQLIEGLENLLAEHSADERVEESDEAAS